MIRAYHFVGDKLRDGRPVPPDGELLVHDGPVKMCESGLHASRHPFDALFYAPGSVLCLVDCDGLAVEDDNKLVCRRRRIVARFDATTMLRAFARQCALDVIHLWDAPQVVRDYLTTGDDSIRAAAMDAAWGAASSAAGDAENAAWGAASSAAGDAAWYAAWYAASSAARYAARYAASSAAGDAAGYAAGDAAWAAARDDQRTRFAGMVDAEFARMGVV